MVTNTLFSPTPTSQHFSKLDQTIINLIIQQAFLKLTSNTAYLNVLNYCLSRMEQLHDIRIVVIDHITTQDNRAHQLAQGLNVSTNDDLTLDDPQFKARYFSCTSNQLEQACDLSSDNLSTLNKCLDHPLTSVSSTGSILNKIINKGWLKQRQFNYDVSSDPLPHTEGPEAAVKAYYRLDFVQLQQDLQTIGYDLMILRAPVNDDLVPDTSTTKGGAQLG